MTPEYLACPDTNPGLEPLRRAIEASVSTLPQPQPQPQPHDRFEVTGRDLRPPSRDITGKWVQPVLSSTSLENPLLRLSEAEFRTLR